MKYCPECEIGFSDSEHFCELDGAQLVSIDPDEPQCEIVFPDSDYFCEPDDTPLASVEPDAPECETDFLDSDHSYEPNGTQLASVEPDAPECDTEFTDSEHFCEPDGTRLVSADPDVAEDETDFVDSDHLYELDGTPFGLAGSEAELKSDSNLRMVAIAITGVVIGVVLFLIYHAMTREPAPQSSNRTSSNASVVMQQPVQLMPSILSPVASPSPPVEPSPSPSPMPSPSPSPQTERRLELSSSAISTDVSQKTKSGPLIIRLKDGASIKSDEAWQTKEGIWYRRGSVIALLDPKEIKAIDKVAPAAPQPATSAPSPSQSPAPSPSQSPPSSPSQKSGLIRVASQSSPRIQTPTRRQR